MCNGFAIYSFTFSSINSLEIIWTIFQLSNITGFKFYLFTLLGLLPGQLVGICIGASLRSMKDVLDDNRISTFTYLLALFQVSHSEYSANNAPEIMAQNV